MPEAYTYCAINCGMHIKPKIKLAQLAQTYILYVFSNLTHANDIILKYSTHFKAYNK